MPRKISPDSTFDDIEDDILFTDAALKADPDAVRLASETESWLPMVDAARAKDRQGRQAVTQSDALRVIANGRLDQACVKFGDELLLATGKDKASTRFQQFFPLAVSRFVRQALVRQVGKVRAWSTSTDPVFLQHKPAIERWCTAAEQALQKTNETALVRGQSRMAREQLAEDLTRERDGLHAALVSLAHEAHLPREWPDLFFRTQSRAATTDAAAAPAGPTPTG